MCLILLAYKSHPEYPFVFAANRDEFYERPSLAADFWKERPDILGGLDLRGGGTWLGITRKGRFAALTNFRDPSAQKMDAPSRGELVSRFLKSGETAAQYLRFLEENGPRYNGFSLIFGQVDDLRYYCNRNGSGKLAPGIHGLSNACLDVPWPKVRRGTAELKRAVDHRRGVPTEELFTILADRSAPEDDNLPLTGVGLEWERVLSPLFIVSPVYGTRASTVIVIDRHGSVIFEERTFDEASQPWMTARFAFTLKDAR